MVSATASESRASRAERAWAIFVPRAILGFVYLFAGVHKLADIGVGEFGRIAALQPDASRLLPGTLLLAIGTLTPFVELALGVLLLAGLWTRLALRCLAVLLVGITMVWGVAGLLHPALTSRLAIDGRPFTSNSPTCVHPYPT